MNAARHHSTKTTDEPVAAKPDLALITARVLRDHLGSSGLGKHAAELDEAIKANEPKQENPEPAEETYD